MKKIFLLSLLLSGLIQGSANGALANEIDQSTQLDDVVVTSTKVKKELLYVPAAVSLITSEEIKEQGHNELVSFLKSIPGLHVSIDASGSQFFIRGQSVPGGEGVIIYIDGRKANYTGKAGTGLIQGHNLDDIPIEIIESIEVIKAPAASIYGAGAAQGIIHIHTKKSQKSDSNMQGNVSASYGSWQTAKANMAVRGASDRIYYSANFSTENSEGFRQTDKEIYWAEASIGFHLTKENRLEFVLGANQSDRKYPDRFNLENDVKTNRNNGEVRVPASNGRFGPTPAGYQYPTAVDSSLIYGGIDYQGQINETEINSALHLTRLNSDTLQPGVIYDDGTTGKDTTNDRSNDIIQYDLSLRKEVFNQDALQDSVTVGMDYESYGYDNVKSRSKYSTVKTRSKRYGFFINNDLAYDKFSMLAGVRFDAMDWSLKNAIPASYDGSFKKTSWDIAPSYRVNKDMTVFYSFSQSYFLPNAFHLSMPSWFAYAGSAAPTPEGQVPEKNLTHELGIKHLLSKYFNYNLTLYQTATENKYKDTNDFIGGGFTGFKPVGNATSKGVELSVDGNMTDWLAYRGGVSWIDVTWDNGTLSSIDEVMTDLSGKKLTDVPAWVYSAGVTIFPVKNLSWAVDMIYEKEAYADDVNTTLQDSYLTFDSKLNYVLSENFSLAALCTNLLDKEYDKQYESEYDPRPGRYMELAVTYRF
ncbi:MAG: hypothetical protein CSA50_06110 [Gammaproteobacteria bacterium]|nr:MAG: hypothetical protein CSA50_06110 [Gammaproteobacteria bacterium]